MHSTIISLCGTRVRTTQCEITTANILITRLQCELLFGSKWQRFCLVLFCCDANINVDRQYQQNFNELRQFKVRLRRSVHWAHWASARDARREIVWTSVEIDDTIVCDIRCAIWMPSCDSARIWMRHSLRTVNACGTKSIVNCAIRIQSVGKMWPQADATRSREEIWMAGHFFTSRKWENIWNSLRRPATVFWWRSNRETTFCFCKKKRWDRN